MTDVSYAQNMNWNNASVDALPADGQEVLMSVDGVYYIGIYKSHEQIFKLKDQPDQHFKLTEYRIYWTEFTNPE
jgi:hypothetical protein